MIISKVTREELGCALLAVNGRFRGNVKWFAELRTISGTQWSLRLAVKNNKGPGSRFSANNWGKTRRTSSACWHVHGYFFDMLPEGAVVWTYGQKREQGQWDDFQYGGGLDNPQMISELCECHE